MRVALVALGSWLAAAVVVGLLVGAAARRLRSAPDAALPQRPAAAEAGPRPAVTVETALVVVHGLRASASVVAGSGEALRASWHAMDDDQRRAVLDTLVEHGLLIEQLIDDVLQAAPADLRRALDELDAARPLPDVSSEATAR